MQSNVSTPRKGYWGRVIEQRPRYRNLTEEQMDLIIQSRLTDLKNIRVITLYSIAPLILLSFGGGYSIASFALKPLDDLNKKMKNKSTGNLGEEIEFQDKGDEISQLIKSFNRMSRRLNKSFEAQKEFVENASHELKTPLAIIQANLDTALEDEGISNNELEEILISSKESVRFMDKLIEDLLLLSVLEHRLSREEVDLGNLLNNIVEESQVLIGSREIDIKLSGKTKVPLIKGNEVLLKRAFMNIMENAIKYSEASKIKIKYKENKEREIEITIKDNGKGIPKEYIGEIFNRFYRVDKSRTRNTGGSGLGLSISKEIIQRFGGAISVDSSIGKGSQFTINLPSIRKG